MIPYRSSEEIEYARGAWIDRVRARIGFWSEQHLPGDGSLARVSIVAVTVSLFPYDSPALSTVLVFAGVAFVAYLASGGGR